MSAPAIQKLLDAVLVTGAGSAKSLSHPTAQGLGGSKMAFQATVVGTGAVTATVKVQVSLNGTHWLDLATITLSGTTSASDGVVAEGPWSQIRGNVTAVSGTSAAVTLLMAN